MTVLIQHDFLFVLTYQSVINCLIVHTITVSFVSNLQYYYIHSEAFSELNHVSDFFTAQGELDLADELCKIISKAQSLYVKTRLANAVQKNITDFNAK